MAGTPPNIVYIHSHDTGRYVQPYGHGIPTPNIQLLADQGVLVQGGVLRSAHLLGQPRVASHRPVLPPERDARPRPSGLVAERQRRALDPRAAPRRLSLVADRRAAHRGRSGVDRLRRHLRRRLEPRRERGARGDRGDQQRARALLPLGRILRDAPELRRPHLRSRHALLPAARGPARHAADTRGRGGVQGERPLARPGHRRGSQRALSGRARRPHADRLHHRPRAWLSRTRRRRFSTAAPGSC